MFLVCVDAALLLLKNTQFFQALADEKRTGQAYRYPGLLATSMFKGVARRFMERRPENTQKVLFTIALSYDEGKLDHSRRPRHVAFLNKSEGRGEYEFLFSAYSSFRVHSVQVRLSASGELEGSASRPHEIFLVASQDNKFDSEDIPTAPWG